MVGTIIKREFQDNILSFKFIACVLVAIVVISICTFVLTADYQDRLKNYDKGVALAQKALSGVPTYSCMTVLIYKRPSPLSIFISGTERKAGSHVEIRNILMEIPTFLRGGGTKNQFSDMVSVFDFSAVIIVIFTLLAILLSYNSISGEKEDGLLSLILSNSVPRYKFLLGKYLGALISIAVPQAFCFIWGILIVAFSGNIKLDGEFLTSIALLFFLSMTYLSFNLLLGIFISSRTKSSFMSLLILLACYLLFIFLLPQALRTYSAGRIHDQTKNVEKYAQSLLDERSKKIEEARKDLPQTKSWWLRDHFYMELYQGRAIVFSRINPPEAIKRQKALTSIRSGTEREYAEKVYELVDRDLQIENRIRRNMNNLLVFNPPFNFERAMDMVADTGEDSLNRFFKQIHFYWQQYMRYLDEKGAFGQKYFYPGPEKLTPYEQELISRINADPSWQTARGISILYTGKYLKEARDYKPNIPFIDLSDMPSFRFQTLKLSDKIEACLVNMIVLLFYNLLFLILAHLSFNRYDPRK
jgi:ABC-type transport system involved in multi-copper enzyme maturation permease subunit